jgi:steroid delta-isomerase-like uncharacterized protein
MSKETICQLAIGLMKTWNAHDLDGVETFYALEYEGVDVGAADPQLGPKGARQAFERYLRAFPDLQFAISDMIVDGNQVVLVWQAHGTHQGTLMHIPPTYRTIMVWGTSLLTVEDGKIWRARYIWDVAGLLRAIGLLPEL